MNMANFRINAEGYTQGIIETNYTNIDIRSSFLGVIKKWASFTMLIKGTFDKQIFDILLFF